MEEARYNELFNLASNRIKRANSYLGTSPISEIVRKILEEEAEIPGFESKQMPFGKFVKKEFVVMMTDIRKSTDIINAFNGEANMFKIFYAYSAVVANIVDKNSGTSTEFLGDGIINLFEVSDNRDEAFKRSIRSAKDILFVRNEILNPLFIYYDLPTIDIGIGIDHGETIVTRFGHKTDNDLKAFGKCVYNVTRLSKGINKIMASSSAEANWPKDINGALSFIPSADSTGDHAYEILDSVSI